MSFHLNKYYIYGLKVQSDCPIGDLGEEGAWSGPADVALHFGRGLPHVESGWSPCPAPRSGRADPRLECSAGRGVEGSYLQLRYRSEESFIAFVIGPGGRQVWWDWTEGLPYGWLAGLLMGQVLSAVLLRRGVTCLHASAVVADGRAVTFLGPPGAGKSTTMAALHRRGCLPLADDLVALTRDDAGPADGGFLVQPGCPNPKLRLDAAQALFGAGAPLVPTWRGGEHDPARTKFFLQRDREPAASLSGPVRLAAIYLLDPRGPSSSKASVVTVAGVDRLMSLTPHARARVLLGEQDRACDFVELARLATMVPIRRVRRPDRLASLPAVCDAILADVASLPGSTPARRN